jgi:Flp pilus assembly protein protease CpaA
LCRIAPGTHFVHAHENAMTPALAHRQTDLAASMRHAYRRLVALPAGLRWAIGFAAPGAAVAAWLAVAQVLPGAAPPTPATGLLAWVLVASVVSDLLWRRIFNFVLGPAVAWIAVLHLLQTVSVPTGLPHASESAIGLAVCFGMMLTLHLAFGGGEGDVKLVALLGAVLGWWHGVEAAVAGYLLAAAVALVVVLIRFARRALAGGNGPVFAGAMPMAPFFALGVLFTLS